MENHPYRDREFHEFVDRHVQNGINGDGDNALFICPSDLEDHWTEANIEQVLNNCQCDGYAPITVITESYLAIFSILVFIGQPEFIAEFIGHNWHDGNLPMLDGGPFTESPTISDMIGDFRTAQWRFCPVLFTNERRWHRRKLNRQEILPIEEKEPLAKQVTSGAKTIVSKVKLFKNCADIAPEGIVVFKEYQCHEYDDLRKSWDREVVAFSRIRSEDHIVRYLGAFEQNNKCVVILEYANGGTLLELFHRNQQPRTRSEVINLWESLMKLLKGVHHLHNLGAGGRMGCAHRDIKPANILVFELVPGSFKGLELKISDFDASTDIRPVSFTETGIQDNGGSRTYACPEACRLDEVEESDMKHVSLDCDVWSTGCVFSEVLVWLGGQQAALEEYTAARKSANNHLKGSGYEASFHDGISVLPCVEAAHEKAIDGLKKFDDFSPIVKGLIEDHMLQPGGPDQPRQAPMAVWRQFKACQRKFSEQKALDPTSSPELGDTTAMGPSRNVSGASTSSSTARPPLRNNRTSSGILGNMKRQSDALTKTTPSPSTRHWQHMSHTSTASDIPNGNRKPGGDDSGHDRSISTNRRSQPRRAKNNMYPEMSIATVLKHRDDKLPKSHLAGFTEFSERISPRHFLFVIDDSKSMRQYKEQILATADAFLWLVKDIDAKIELRFASEPKKRYPSYFQQTFYSYQALIRKIRQRLVSKPGTECNMERQLDNIFDEKVINKSRPTSVLIFTDGIWEPATDSKGGNVEESVQSVVDKMDEEGIKRTDFTIQFVRFGHNTLGVSRLTYLDDDLGFRNRKGDKRDIVDHKYHEDNVWSILIGAQSDANDNLGASERSLDDKEHEDAGTSSDDQKTFQ